MLARIRQFQAITTGYALSVQAPWLTELTELLDQHVRCGTMPGMTNMPNEEMAPADWDMAHDAHTADEWVDEADVDPVDLPDWENDAPRGYTVLPTYHCTPALDGDWSAADAEWQAIDDAERWQDAMADAYYA